MTNDEIRNVILECLEEIAPEVDASTLGGDDSLREELDIDSMDFLNYVTALHEKLGVSVPEADYPKVDSLDGAVAYVAERA
ncbi:MAG TPA: acyl carrier protein [Sandaracinaceae bacterium LLY-WYZ-13_1]|nr:acyl carrier protein [Sandaracinaceae bacterium LLY-WYZ-13_1]